MTEPSPLAVGTDFERVTLVRSARLEPSGWDLLDHLGKRVPILVVGRNTIGSLEALDPSVVIVKESSDFDITRLCRDIHRSLRARLVVIGGPNATDESKAIALLDDGVDDYLPSDISMDMLLARIRVALRSRPPAPHQSRIVVGDLIMDLEAHELLVDGRLVHCRPRLFVLLVELASHPNRVVTRETLLRRVWSVEPGLADSGRIRIAISLLRDVLGRGPRRPRIETVSRVGYRLAVNTAETPVSDAGHVC